MNAKQMVFSIFKTCLAIAILMLVGTFVIKMAGKAYDFGYRIFKEEPMSPAPGYTMSVAIVEGKSAKEIGIILEEKGLIRDANLFYLQELVSDYHDKLMPGVYELSTAMTPEEMMAVMAASYVEPGEETGEEETVTSSDYEASSDSTVSDNAPVDVSTDMNDSENITQ